MDQESDSNNIIFNEDAEEHLQNERILSMLKKVLVYLGLQRVEIGINIVSAAEMRSLNREYRGKDKSTDILTFALLEESDEPLSPETLPDKLALARELGEDPVLLGDIILSSAEVDTSTSPGIQHTFRLIIHGLLHLLGYDHQHAEQRRRMEDLEKRCLVHILGEEGQ